VKMAREGVEMAANLLLKQMAGEQSSAREIRLRSDMIWRASVSPPRPCDGG